MEKITPTIAVVFATMNRAQVAMACLDALVRQTHLPDWVIVADNISKDDTRARLRAMNGLPYELVVHEMDENRGNAGGVQEAMDLAFERGADYVWILDDDSIPRPEALQALMAIPHDFRTVRHSIQIDPSSRKFTWPMWVMFDGKWTLIDDQAQIKGGKSVHSQASWTGALVSKEIWKDVGPVNGALFIRGEDEEYPWRIAKAGYSFEAVLGSVLDHPGPQELVHWKFLGKNLFVERALADWKLYYKIRNMVWLKRQQSGIFHALAMAGAYGVAVLKIDRFSRLGLVWEATCDGLAGRLGRWNKHPF